MANYPQFCGHAENTGLNMLLDERGPGGGREGASCRRGRRAQRSSRGGGRSAYLHKRAEQEMATHPATSTEFSVGNKDGEYCYLSVM